MRVVAASCEKSYKRMYRSNNISTSYARYTAHPSILSRKSAYLRKISILYGTRENYCEQQRVQSFWASFTPVTSAS